MSLTSKAVTRTSLDMGKVDVQKSVSFTKGDVNRRWEVTLTDNGSPFDLPGRWTVALSAIKPDETAIYNGCTVEHGRILYDFASGEQIATSEGVFSAQFDIFDETGQPVCSPRVWIHILPVARNLAAMESDPQFTLLRQFLETAADLNADVAEIRERVSELLTLGKITVPAASWSENPIRVVLKIPELVRNTATLVYPADEKTRQACIDAEASAYVTDPEATAPEIVLNAKSRVSATLTLIYAITRADRTGVPLSAAALMGVGGGGGEPGSFRYVSDGKGKVTVFGKPVETVDETARNKIAALEKRLEDTGTDDTQDSRLSKLEDQVADLLYEAISITSFTSNVSTAEMGSTVTAVTLAWAFNKAPVSVTLDGAEQAADSEGTSLSGLSITESKTWTLKATDERDATATKTTGISFLNGVYYGAAEAPDTVDSAFILGLTKVLRGSKLASFTVTAGEGQYVFYCVPKRFGTCSFTVGGFDGGFDLAATVSFTNASGYTEDYYVYRSANAGLGVTTVGVK